MGADGDSGHHCHPLSPSQRQHSREVMCAGLRLEGEELGGAPRGKVSGHSVHLQALLSRRQTRGSPPAPALPGFSPGRADTAQGSKRRVPPLAPAPCRKGHSGRSAELGKGGDRPASATDHRVPVWESQGCRPPTACPRGPPGPSPPALCARSRLPAQRRENKAADWGGGRAQPAEPGTARGCGQGRGQGTAQVPAETRLCCGPATSPGHGPQHLWP